jgi:hypothetical protein
VICDSCLSPHKRPWFNLDFSRRKATAEAALISFVDPSLPYGLFLIFKRRRTRIVARLTTLDRLVFFDGGFSFDVDPFAFNQARRFVGLF